MPAAASTKTTTASRSRLLVMAGAAAVAAVAAGLLLGWQYSATIGWAIACAVYLAWVWGSIARLDDRAGERSSLDALGDRRVPFVPPGPLGEKGGEHGQSHGVGAGR